MTEDVAGRAEVVAANVRAVVLALAVALPIALIAPLQWWVLGASASQGRCSSRRSIGWLLVEWRWRLASHTLHLFVHSRQGIRPSDVREGLRVVRVSSRWRVASSCGSRFFVRRRRWCLR